MTSKELGLHAKLDLFIDALDRQNTALESLIEIVRTQLEITKFYVEDLEREHR